VMITVFALSLSIPVWEIKAWFWIMKLNMAGDLLIVSCWYLPALLLATAVYWWLWIMNKIQDLGSMPKFRNLLIIMWLPISLPVVTWVGCMVIIMATLKKILSK